MGKKQSVNKNYIIPDQYKEFRAKYLKKLSGLPFNKFNQEDLNKINLLYKAKLDETGMDKFNETEFINSIPKLDSFTKKVFIHLFKILYDDLANALQADYPDIRQFFIIFTIYLFSNTKLEKNKFVLANMIDLYLKRPKKEKKDKKKKKEDEKEKENFKENNEIINDKEIKEVKEEPKVLKKKLNIVQISGIFKYLYTFTKTILTYFLLMHIFMFDSMKTNLYLFESDKAKEIEGRIIYDLEFTFQINFGLINRDFNVKDQEKIWVDYLLEPLNYCNIMK